MIVDITVAGVLLLSGVLAYSMGLAKFLLLIVSWLGAAVAAYFGFQHLGGLFGGFTGNPLTQAIAAAVLVFVVTLAVLTYVTHKICNHIRGSVLGHLDRALGFALGLVLGVVLVSLIYVGSTLFWDEDNFPDQIADAKTLPLIRSGAGVLAALLPKGTLEDDHDLEDAAEDVEGAVKDLTKDPIKEIEEKVEEKLESIEAEERLNILLNPPEDEDAKKEPGYKEEEIEGMQQLIEETNQ